MELKTEAEETKQKEQKKQEQEEEEEQQEQHFHVLAVDDSVLDRKLLERLLKVSSYQVTCVDSVDKALEYLGLLNNLNCDSTASSSSTSSLPSSQEGLKVNLIMTDYCMPGMSGYDLLKRVKGSSWKDVPVVVMSSENVPSRISMCLEGGAEEFFLKPLQLSDLQKLQPYLLKSMENSCESMEEEEEEEGPNNESGESDQKKDSNSEGHKSKNGFIKRKAVCPEPPERRPKIKGLEVV